MSKGKKKPGNSHVRMRELEVKLTNLATATDKALKSTNSAVIKLAQNDDAKNQLLTTLIAVLKDSGVITEEAMKKRHANLFDVKPPSEQSPLDKTDPETEPEGQVQMIVDEDQVDEESN